MPPLPQPARHRGDRVEPVARRGLARRADQDAGAAQRGGGGEGMLVGQIVAHEPQDARRRSRVPS